MKRTTLGVAVATLTFLIGFSATAVWLNRSHAPKRCVSDSYFPGGVLGRPEGKAKLLGEYYSALMESPFSCLDEEAEAYRFLFMPSFDPAISIRVWRAGGQKYITVKQLSGIGYPPGEAKDLKVNVTRSLTEQEWNRFQELLAKSDFWSMPMADVKPSGIDGANWLLEGKKSGKYHVVDRWMPEDQNFLDACGYLFEISGLKLKQ
jgi:hypothetical protein